MQSLVSSPIIGYHRSPLTQKFGVPRQPNLTNVASYIEMLPPYNTADAFIGIEDFTHLWITWQAHHNGLQTTFKPKVRPPRLGGNSKLGVFATRSTYRPSQLGLSVVQLVDVIQTDKGVVLHIMGADMVDATPVIDIKPYVAYSDALLDAKSGFAQTKPLIKSVQVTDMAKRMFNDIIVKNEASNNNVSKNDSYHYHQTLTRQDMITICALIAQDPRPAYRQEDIEHTFIMRYKNVDIGFRMHADGVLWIETVDYIDS